jgi:hypothetical protein
MMAQVSTQIRNKAIVRESFDRWKSGNGSPFELLGREPINLQGFGWPESAIPDSDQIPQRSEMS